MKTILIWLFAMAVSLSAQAHAHFRPEYGFFEGTLVLKVLSGSSKMKIAEKYAFIDSAGGRWEVPLGYESDGASIPRAAFSFVGDPWGADYRNAAVIHDVACDKKLRPWRSVHLAFYHAMLAAGVSPEKAMLMYAAVYYFGPRWELRTRARPVNIPAVSGLGRSIRKESAVEGVRITRLKPTRESAVERVRITVNVPDDAVIIPNQRTMTEDDATALHEAVTQIAKTTNAEEAVAKIEALNIL